ncbi:MAG: winged helix-turn-helix transcriptional regulator [Verrucomicrobiae bacterium]|nr:winged helix-turn-helix transcriptional regulator [Verrucomicrobiae bacterium]
MIGRSEHQKHTLPILEAIESSPDFSQREISRQTEVSLGLVNAVLKDLIHRGLVRAAKIPRKRYAYYLTPHGLAEKTRLAMSVFENTLNAYQRARQLSDTRAAEFKRQGVHEVALVGHGPRLELAYLACLQSGLKVIGIYCEKTRGSLTLGFEVKPLGECPPHHVRWEVNPSE